MASGRLGAGKWPVAALATLCLIAAGCGGGLDDEPEPTTTASPAAGTDESPAEQAGEEASDSDTVELYFTAGEQFKKVKRELPEGGSQVEHAAEELIDGPTGDEASGDAGAQTNIPDGAKLEGVSVEDGTAVVEVSRDFLKGVPAKAAARNDAQEAELNARLGQVTYTLTQFDRVQAAKVVAGGVSVEPARERADYSKPKQGPERTAHAAAAARSLATREVQKRLAKLGYLPPGAVDGEPGYRTTQAVIAFQSWEGLDRDGVVGPITTAALSKAKRPNPRASGPSRRIEVHRDKGVALLVTHGETRRAIHVSSGAPGTSTPAGTFEVFRKELRSWSVPFQVWLPYASYFNQGIAFHEYPDVPPYPASHGCVRVPAPEAPLVYKFAKFGTAVIVI
jgi:lipoprotein-anchoring transpeptidase ErfK/SrfK